MKKMLNSFVCVVLLICCMSTIVSSAEGISLYANNTNKTTTDFTISNNTATVFISYIGIDGVTTNAVITTKIQKRFLLVFWQDVDGASWTDYSNDTYYVNSHSIEVKSGTYRALVEYTIYGTGGTADVISNEFEAKN